MANLVYPAFKFGFVKSYRRKTLDLRHFLRFLETCPYRLFFDELANIGVIPDLTKKISTVRSRKISMSVIFQNIAQMQNRYPDNAWLEIIGNCDTQLFLGCTDELTAKFISDRTGEVTIGVESMSKELSATRMTNYTPSHRETSSIGKRKLLTPDEVLRLPREDALIIFRGQKVLKVKKFDFTKHPESRKMHDCNARDYIPNWRTEEEIRRPMGVVVDSSYEGDVNDAGASGENEIPVATTDERNNLEKSVASTAEPIPSVKAKRRKRNDTTHSTPQSGAKRSSKSAKHNKAIEENQLSLEDVVAPITQNTPKESHEISDLQLSLSDHPDTATSNLPRVKPEESEEFGYEVSHHPYGAIGIEDLLSDL